MFRFIRKRKSFKDQAIGPISNIKDKDVVTLPTWKDYVIIHDQKALPYRTSLWGHSRKCIQ
jgi:hypothetical protein